MREDPIQTSAAGKDEPQAGGRPEGDAPLPARARRWLLPATVTVSALLFIGLLAFGLRAQAPNGGDRRQPRPGTSRAGPGI